MYINLNLGYRHQPISKDNYCLNGGPISFRPRYGKSIPNCLPAPGPVIKQTFVSKSNTMHHLILRGQIWLDFIFCVFSLFGWFFVLFCCYHHQINISLRSVLFPPLSPSLSVVEFKTWPSFKFVLWKQGWQGSTDNKGDRVGKKPQLNIFLNTVLWNSTIHGGSVFLVHVFVDNPPPPFNESLGKTNLDNVFFLTISKLLC